MGRRVFISEIGVVSPLGNDTQAAFEAVCQGRSAVRMTRTGTEELGGRLPLAPCDFDPSERIPKREAMLQARASQMAVFATFGVLESSGLLGDAEALANAGIYMGCGLGGADVLQSAYSTYFERRSRRLRPSTVPLIMASGPASHMSMRFGIGGPSHSYSIACASSTVAIGEAFRAIRDGYADRVLAGGAEAMLNDASVAAWERLGVLAKPHPDGPETSSRPFDAARTGLVLGEGAAVLILESEEAVAARGVAPIAEIIGYGASSDAHKLTEPHADGQERAFRAALADAGVTPSDVGYVNAHATGTVAGDAVELDILERVFGTGSGVAVSSTKSVHGHLVGATGAVECALTALTLQQQRVPPTAHLEDVDPPTPLDLVRGELREVSGLEIAASNSFAFGGSNATLVLRRA
jgi:3-oxoacyl-[acyl-carrier-protein] synthase II